MCQIIGYSGFLVIVVAVQAMVSLRVHVPKDWVLRVFGNSNGSAAFQ